MSPDKWQASDDPKPMLSVLLHNRNIDERKLRLLICAFARLVFDLVPNKCRIAVEAAERYANSLSYSAEELIFANHAAQRVMGRNAYARLAWRCTCGITGMLDGLREEAKRSVLYAPRQAHLIREVFGNPLRPVTLPNALPKRFCRDCHSPMTMEANHHHQLGLWYCAKDRNHVTRSVTVDEMKIHKSGGCPWLTHADGLIPKMARAIHDKQAWDEMPVFADALEEAGCRDDLILQHCRGKEPCTDETHHQAGGNYWCPSCGGTEEGSEGWMDSRGPHVRGCWVIDQISNRSQE